MSNLYFFKKSFFVIIISLFLSACGGGNGAGNKLSAIGATGTTGSGAPVNNNSSITLSGSVGDGPVSGATVVIKNASGKTLKSVSSDEHAKYSVTLEVNTNDYPLMIEASGGIDLVTSAAPDFTLYSVVTDPSERIANLNPFTTMIVKTAEFMRGGLTPANIKIATSKTLQQLNFGLDSTLVPDPVTSPVSQSNIADIVKSSETFGEMIRRTRNTLNNGKTANDVMADLAEDLSDGNLDGVTKNKPSPRTSNVSRL
ncbi:MAG TPA: carboxypeptidase regulatory-like domain-containing protein, partial [Gammaproteobacteria bacterium]|nr:carboxypeptidase regulatory-like domain-containing protein [Gammaproteobacteria bacterium]